MKNLKKPNIKRFKKELAREMRRVPKEDIKEKHKSLTYKQYKAKLIKEHKIMVNIYKRNLPVP